MVTQPQRIGELKKVIDKDTILEIEVNGSPVRISGITYELARNAVVIKTASSHTTS